MPSKLPAGLYIVSTPIGHAADITLRALEVLAKADLVVCEDTRRTGKLLAIHQISARLKSYHEHNAARVRPALLRRLGGGAAIALVSDAGTPLVSDPGYRLVVEAAAAGVPVVAVPGPSAVLAALTVAALPTDRFMSVGFLPPRAPARRRAIEALAGVDSTLILFESGRRLAAALADMAAILGPRPAAVTRELTKRHEEVRRGTLAALAESYAREMAKSGRAPRGEIVVVVGPPPAAGAAEVAPAEVDSRLRNALTEMTTKDAAAALARATGLPRRALYARAVALRKRARDKA